MKLHQIQIKIWYAANGGLIKSRLVRAERGILYIDRLTGTCLRPDQKTFTILG